MHRKKLIWKHHLPESLLNLSILPTGPIKSSKVVYREMVWLWKTVPSRKTTRQIKSQIHIRRLTLVFYIFLALIQSNIWFNAKTYNEMLQCCIILLEAKENISLVNDIITNIKFLNAYGFINSSYCYSFTTIYIQ